MRRDKLKGSDDVETMIVKMSEGNIGAVTVLTNLLKGSFQGIGTLLGMDDMNIRGEQIWVAFKYYCESDMELLKKKINERDLDMVSFINKELNYKIMAVHGGASYAR